LRNQVLGPHVNDVPSPCKAFRYFVSGTVQGVGYRFFARRAALRLGLTGFTKNLDDGRVEVYAIGRVESLAAFRDELSRGPFGAKVSGIAHENAEIDSRFTTSFSIEH
jgi:acylphosphatase